MSLYYDEWSPPHRATDDIDDHDDDNDDTGRPTWWGGRTETGTLGSTVPFRTDAPVDDMMSIRGTHLTASGHEHEDSKEGAFKVGDLVEVRDGQRAPFQRGVVTEILYDGQPKVRRDRFSERSKQRLSWTFREVRRWPHISSLLPRPSPPPPTPPTTTTTTTTTTMPPTTTTTPPFTSSASSVAAVDSALSLRFLKDQLDGGAASDAAAQTLLRLAVGDIVEVRDSKKSPFQRGVVAGIRSDGRPKVRRDNERSRACRAWTFREVRRLSPMASSRATPPRSTTASSRASSFASSASSYSDDDQQQPRQNNEDEEQPVVAANHTEVLRRFHQLEAETAGEFELKGCSQGYSRARTTDELPSTAGHQLEDMARGDTRAMTDIKQEDEEQTDILADFAALKGLASTTIKLPTSENEHLEDLEKKNRKSEVRAAEVEQQTDVTIESGGDSKLKGPESTAIESLSDEGKNLEDTARRTVMGDLDAPTRLARCLDHFYEVKNPEKRSSVGETLRKWRGQESSLFAALKLKHGPLQDSAAQEAQASALTEVMKENKKKAEADAATKAATAKKRWAKATKAVKAANAAKKGAARAAKVVRESKVASVSKRRLAAKSTNKHSKAKGGGGGEGKGWASAAPNGPKEIDEVTKRLERCLNHFYAVKNPEKGGGARETLRKWRGQEDKLFNALESKYGPHPDMGSQAAQANALADVRKKHKQRAEMRAAMKVRKEATVEAKRESAKASKVAAAAKKAQKRASKAARAAEKAGRTDEEQEESAVQQQAERVRQKPLHSPKVKEDQQQQQQQQHEEEDHQCMNPQAAGNFDPPQQSFMRGRDDHMMTSTSLDDDNDDDDDKSTDLDDADDDDNHTNLDDDDNDEYNDNDYSGEDMLFDLQLPPIPGLPSLNGLPDLPPLPAAYGSSFGSSSDSDSDSNSSSDSSSSSDNSNSKDSNSDSGSHSFDEDEDPWSGERRNGVPTDDDAYEPWELGPELSSGGAEAMAGRFEVLGKREHILGDGASGIVRLCRELVLTTDGSRGAAGSTSSGRLLACKVICKKRQSRGDTAREISIMRRLSGISSRSSGTTSPLVHVARLVDVFEAPEQLFVISELCEGGEVYQHIINRGKMEPKMPFREAEAATIMKQVLSSMALLHSDEHRIVHRDIKPENLLLRRADGNLSEVVLVDFGLSRFFEPGQRLTTIVGTVYYTASEVYSGQYDHRCDVFSAGVLLYVLLCLYCPFSGDDDGEVQRSVMRGRVDFPADEWGGVSDDAKDLIRRLLGKYSHLRPEADEALRHPWFARATAGAGAGSGGAGGDEDSQGETRGEVAL